MALYTISPQPWLVFLDGQFYVPAGQLAIYRAGTSDPAVVYTSANGTAHLFPITLDSAGRVPGGLYLQPGMSYKFVLHQPMIDQDLDGAVIKTQDNVAATPSAGGAIGNLGAPGSHVADVTGLSILEYTGAGDVTINGLSGGIPGQDILIRNRTAFTVFLNPQEGTVPPSQQLLNSYQYGPLLLVGARGYARYTYFGGALWGLTGHSQGEAYVQPYSALNYDASPGMAWTVQQADLGPESFLVQGRTLFYSFFIVDTSVSGTPGPNLTRAIPLGWRSFLSAYASAMQFSEVGGTFSAGIATRYDDSHVAFQKPSGVNWINTNNLTGVIGQIPILLT